MLIKAQFTQVYTVKRKKKVTKEKKKNRYQTLRKFYLGTNSSWVKSATSTKLRVVPITQ